MDLAESTARLLRYLEAKDDILLLTTSSRYREHTWDRPKTTELAMRVRARLEESAKRVTLLDVSRLKIHTCEGNVSGGRGNNCGAPEAKLDDAAKNPTGHHRCWASFNNPDDQLHEVSRALFRSSVVIFFVSVRWGQTNSVYQRLFERLSWIENRVSTLGETPIPELRDLEAGMVLFGHNWNARPTLETQKRNFAWFGWKTPEALSFAWQYTDDENEESLQSYLGAIEEFRASRAGSPAATPSHQGAARTMPDLSEDTKQVDAQITAVRANIRELIDQATGRSGAADDELASRRMAEQEARLAALKERRGALAG